MSNALPVRRFLLAAFVLASAAACLAGDLTQAVVVAPKELSPREQKAVTMLVEEVEKRSHVRWPVVAEAPEKGKPTIYIAPASKPLPKEVAQNVAPIKPEGFHLVADKDEVIVSGNDERGTLFGIGYLLRQQK